MKNMLSDNTFCEQIDELFDHYDHIIGKQRNDNLTLLEIVKQISNYYEDIIYYLPGHVYWFNQDCIAVGANKNVLDQLQLSSIDEFKGMSYEDIRQRGGWGIEETEFFKKQSLEILRLGQASINIEEPSIPNLYGNPTFFLSSRVPLFDNHKNIIGLVGISIDITKLRHTQDELRIAKEIAEQSSRLKSEFVTNMSHDLKTPLAGIISLSELLTERLQGEEQEIAKTLMLSGKQLLNLLEDCLQIFKLEANNVLLNEEKFNLTVLLEEVKQTFSSIILAKKLKMSILIDENCPALLIGNRTELYRILSNLVSNAVKFTDTGFITIQAKPLANLVHENQNQTIIQFKIIDTGIGIPDEWKHAIFEQFTRITPSYKGIYEGHGIGLYIVNKFVKAMGGTIKIESKESEGSTFIVTLPFKYESHIVTDEKSSAVSTLETPKNLSLRILIVEDNPVAQLMQSKLLSSMGHQITLASSGEEAVDLFSPGIFDLIFMDLGLPGMQGDAVSHIIRQKEASHSTHTPIIALTAHISDEMKRKPADMSVDLICSKPLSREKAKQLIQQALK